MDRRLLGYYNRELKHIRESAAEFAREFPKIAARLGVGSPDVAVEDPYVERLLEGFASSRPACRCELDAEFPRFTQGLLVNRLPALPRPHALDGRRAVQALTCARGASPRGSPSSAAPACAASSQRGTRPPANTARPTPSRSTPSRSPPPTIRPACLATLQTASEPTDKAGIRIRLRAHANLTFDKIKLDRLALHLSGSDETPARLFEQILAHARAVVVQPVGNPVGDGTRCSRARRSAR